MTRILPSAWKETLMDALGIELVSEEDHFIVGTMPIDHRTIQPAGIMHGGASAALAETLGSYGSKRIAEKSDKISVGVELHIHHLKSISRGWVIGKAQLIKAGKTLHLWNIDITDENDELISTARLTVMLKQNTRQSE
ncbi:MAG: PaaI family thioesterase [Flavobacteriales bacterium]